jgi:hypothetical protein
MYWFDSDEAGMENEGYRLDLQPSLPWGSLGEDQYPNVVNGFGYDLFAAISFFEEEITITRVALTQEGIDSQDGEQFQDILIKAFPIPSGLKVAQRLGSRAGAASYHPGD